MNIDLITLSTEHYVLQLKNSFLKKQLLLLAEKTLEKKELDDLKNSFEDFDKSILDNAPEISKKVSELYLKNNL